MWSRDFSQCRECGSAEIRHMARGLCQKCYLAAYVASHQERIAQQKHEWYERFTRPNRCQEEARDKRNFGGMREQVLSRDGYRCVECRKETGLIVHHLDGQGRGHPNPNNDDSNLITLCRACHLNAHRAELWTARKLKAKPRWARQWKACRNCGTTVKAHVGRGLCSTCYQAFRAGKI